MRFIQIVFEFFKAFVRLAEPVVINFHRICVPKFVKRNRITVTEIVWSIVFWTCLMKSGTMNDCQT